MYIFFLFFSKHFTKDITWKLIKSYGLNKWKQLYKNISCVGRGHTAVPKESVHCTDQFFQPYLEKIELRTEMMAFLKVGYLQPFYL